MNNLSSRSQQVQAETLDNLVNSVALVLDQEKVLMKLFKMDQMNKKKKRRRAPITLIQVLMNLKTMMAKVFSR